MQTTTNQPLLGRLASMDLLRKAWAGLNKSNKSSKGLSDLTIQEFQSNLDQHLLDIHIKLSKDTYKFSPLKLVGIPKANKPNVYRPIQIPEIKDRIVLKAITLLIYPAIKEQFPIENPASFAYQTKLSIEDAIRKMVQYYSEGNKVIFEADIIKFFDNVNKEKLLNEKVFPALEDDTINSLIYDGIHQVIGNQEKISDYNFQPEDFEGGIPQGNPLSPLLANLYLVDFDEKLLNEGYKLIRYADDFIIMCKSKEEAENAHILAREFLKNKLALEIHPLTIDAASKTKIVHPAFQHFEFLSIRFTGTELYPSKNKVTSLKQKISEIAKYSDQSNIIQTLTRIRNLLYGWLSAFKFCNIEKFQDDIEKHLNRQLYLFLKKGNWTLNNSTTTKIKIDGKEVVILSESQRKFSGIQTCEEFLGGMDRKIIKISINKGKAIEKVTPTAKELESRVEIVQN